MPEIGYRANLLVLMTANAPNPISRMGRLAAHFMTDAAVNGTSEGNRHAVWSHAWAFR